MERLKGEYLDVAEKAVNKRKTVNTAALATDITFAVIFTAAAAYGVIAYCTGALAGSQAGLIIFQGVASVFLTAAPFVLERVFKLEISVIIRLTVYIFATLAVVFGEAFGFYYMLPWWDKFLHAVSGAMVAFIAYAFIYMMFSKTDVKRKSAASLAVSVLAALAVALLWELLEYAVDSIFLTNMQKFIPENALFNGGSAALPLSGADAEIAEFFRTASGYKYALTDTMNDITVCFIGTAVYAAAGAALIKFCKKSFAPLVKSRKKAVNLV